MTRWSIAQNDYYFTSFIVLENAPWYIFLLQTCIQHICSWFPRIPLPPKKIIRDGHEYTARDYYGTTQDLFHVYVCAPIFCWCDDRIETEFIDFPYQLLEDKFPEYFKSDDLFTEEEVKENREYSELVNQEFNIAYEKLKNITSDRREITTTDESEVVSSFPGISRLVTLDTSQQNNIKIVSLEEFNIMTKQSDLSNKEAT